MNEDAHQYLAQKLNDYQQRFGLESWQIDLQLVSFKTSDHPYRADIDIDRANKHATIFINSRNRMQDEQAMLHELVHLLLWDFDQFCASKIAPKQRQSYLELLEQQIIRLSAILKK